MHFSLAKLFIMAIFIFCSMEKINLYLEGVHQLGDALSPKLTDCTIKEKQAVRLFASLILCILHLLKRICQEETEEAALKIEECRDKLQKFVRDWVIKAGVIGGFLFGGHILHHDRVPKDTEKELKVIS